MDLIMLRGLERILAVVLGGMAIYLGYRLFLGIPKEKNGQGKVVLPGGISIYVTRVGPGVFFALFGSVVVAASLHFSVTYKDTSGPAPGADSAAIGSAGARSKSYTGLGGGSMIEDGGMNLNRTQVRTDIRFLNTVLPGLLRTDVSAERRDELAGLLPRMKMEMLKSVWGPDFGDFDQFEGWVARGAPGPAPENLKEAASYYREGQGARQ
jgi:hypothetical protein